MALLKYNHESFLQAMKPGISALVINAFEKKLEEKLNGIVESVYAELRAELPKDVQARIEQALECDTDTRRIMVEVNLDGGKAL